MDARNIGSSDGAWIRSSRCGPKNGNCVELNRRVDEVAIRDSKSGGGISLIFDHAPWATFVESIKEA
jgi:hypothetical protein